MQWLWQLPRIWDRRDEAKLKHCIFYFVDFFWNLSDERLFPLCDSKNGCKWRLNRKVAKTRSCIWPIYFLDQSGQHFGSQFQRKAYSNEDDACNAIVGALISAISFPQSDFLISAENFLFLRGSILSWYWALKPNQASSRKIWNNFIVL